MTIERAGEMGERDASRGPRARSACVAALLLALLRPGAAAALEHTWSGGGGADTNWSNPANWDGAGPSDNEVGASLTFPALGGHYDSHNDLSGLHVSFLAITTALSDGAYTFSGNPLSLEGPSTLASPGTGEPNLVWLIPLSLGANVTIAASGRQTRLEGDVDLGSRTLTLNVGGDLVVAGVIGGGGNLIKNNTSPSATTGSTPARPSTSTATARWRSRS